MVEAMYLGMVVTSFGLFSTDISSILGPRIRYADEFILWGRLFSLVLPEYSGAVPYSGPRELTFIIHDSFIVTI
jgi:hypothetical protein